MRPTSLPPFGSLLTSGYILNPPLSQSNVRLLLPSCSAMPWPHLYSLPTSFFPLIPSFASLSPSRPQATPLLQSHPAFRDKENTEDQFCSVTFGGGLQSKGMAGEAELREIYWGCLREREEISPPANSQEGQRGEAEKRKVEWRTEEKRRREKRRDKKRREIKCLFWNGERLRPMRLDKRKRMRGRGQKKCLLVTVGQWSFVAQLEALTTERRGQMHRYSIGLEGGLGRRSISWKQWKRKEYPWKKKVQRARQRTETHRFIFVCVYVTTAL